jgi:hypothetical protein
MFLFTKLVFTNGSLPVSISGWPGRSVCFFVFQTSDSVTDLNIIDANRPIFLKLSTNIMSWDYALL